MKSENETLWSDKQDAQQKNQEIEAASIEKQKNIAQLEKKTKT